jgi:hypothetical protein
VKTTAIIRRAYAGSRRGATRFVPLVAFLLVVVYALFQGELFDDEYEANHPVSPGQCSITRVPLSSEGDKENAQEPYLCRADFQLALIFTLTDSAPQPIHVAECQERIRNKSPSLSSFNTEV